MAPPLSHRESIKQSFKTPQTQGFKAKMKRGGYKFGTFMHWVFFKPTSSVVVDDPAQTSFAPVVPEDAGASAADMHNNGSQTMGATRDKVQKGGPSQLQVDHHQPLRA
jgi:hypothetical protein